MFGMFRGTDGDEPRDGGRLVDTSRQPLRFWMDPYVFRILRGAPLGWRPSLSGWRPPPLVTQKKIVFFFIIDMTTSSFLLLVVRPGATSSFLLVAMPFVPSSGLGP